MSDKKENEKDYRKVDQPKAESKFWEPNDLSEALDNLDAYENWSSDDLLFKDDDGQLLVEKHEPYEDADKAKKVKKEAKENTQSETKKFDNIQSELDELLEILKNSDSYFDYLGLGEQKFTKEKNDKNFPMDDDNKKTAKSKKKA